MFDTSRRKLFGAGLLGAGAVLSGVGLRASALELNIRGRILLNGMQDLPKGLIEATRFPLIDAIHGRRSRRFARGASIPDGPLAYTSKHKPAPLPEMEQMLLLTTVGGNTGWSNLIPYNRSYVPKMPNYASYFFPTRDMAGHATRTAEGQTDLQAYLDTHKARIIKLADGRLNTPESPQHMELHNEWCANVPGSTLVIPVADLAQHMLLVMCYLVQNGTCLYDDVTGQPIPGMEKYTSIVDVENPYPLSYVEQLGLTEVTVELSTACYAGALMLQAMGLGGWMYEGINPFSVLGASGDPDVPGLGFRFDMIPGQPLPHVTGLEGVARRISRICALRSNPSSCASSAPMGPSMPRPMAPTGTMPPFAAAR
mgnify:CR=1 FL=1